MRTWRISVGRDSRVDGNAEGENKGKGTAARRWAGAEKLLHY